MNYREKLLDFSSHDKFLRSIKYELFDDPVYLCKSLDNFSYQFSIIKDFIMENLIYVGEDSSFRIGGSLVIPISIRLCDSDIDAILTSSDDVISVIVDKVNFDLVLNEISRKTRRNL